LFFDEVDYGVFDKTKRMDRLMERHRLLETAPSQRFLSFAQFLLAAREPLAEVFENDPVPLAQFGLRQPQNLGQILAAPDLAQNAVRKFLMMCFDEMD
jgi:hypothetical protein